MTEESGLEFLNKLYADLYNSEIVMHTSLSGDTKNEKLEKYLNRLEKITNRAYDDNRRTSSNDINLLKSYYYDKYVIKEDNIPESYFELQKKIALDEGHGYLGYTRENKKLEIAHIILEQKRSLDQWLDYFASEDTSNYPTWFKYYVFQGMLKLGSYDKKTSKFTRRTLETTKPFVEINREAIAFIHSYLVKYLDKKEIEDDDIYKLLEGGSFSKLYAYSLKKLDSVRRDNFKSDEGIWKKYLKDSNPEELFNDIYGKGTGWCTAGGIETATKHLNGGDFYVYYTKDKDGNYTNPRIAIRMQNNSIAEIRGIAENQNLESNMEKVVDEKLEEFPDKDLYKKKVNDMKMMTSIHTKFKNNIELTKEDLRFLYEIDNQIIGFGYGKDPRIEEIIGARNNIRQDLAMVFSCKEENIALNRNEALKGNIRYYKGDLDLSSLTSVDGLELPSQISGYLDLRGLTSAQGSKLPNQIGGTLYLNGLTTAEGLELPNQLSGGLYLSGLTSVEGLELPSQIGEDLDLSSLTSAQGLKLPNQLGGSLDLRCLTNTKGLKLPSQIDGTLYLNGLTTAEGLELPNQLSGGLYLSGLTSVEGLELPSQIGHSLNLSSLTSANGLKLPSQIVGWLDLSSLTSAQGLRLPNQIGGTLYLNGLTTAEGLELPDQIGHSLNLSSLTSANGLKFPSQIGGWLDLSSLTSAEDLELPDKIGGNFNCPFFNNNFYYAKEYLKQQKEINKPKSI